MYGASVHSPLQTHIYFILALSAFQSLSVWYPLVSWSFKGEEEKNWGGRRKTVLNVILKTNLKLKKKNLFILTIEALCLTL